MLLCVDEILGVFDHTEACQQVMEMDRNPHIPLHPDLRNYALELLRMSVPLPQLQQRCHHYAKEQFGDIAGNAHHWFLLSDHETSSLYRTLHAEFGIKQRSAAEQNLDLWFHANNPQPPHAELTDACLFYQPCGDGPDDCFIIILSTPQQRNVAWQHGHNKLLLLDGTFGINSARLLLFIGMVIDEDRKGIPIVFFHFTAQKVTQAAHTDYDTNLLQDLLQKWKLAMGMNDKGEAFNIHVALTDNDQRERCALAEVFLSAQLLLCCFHVSQAWRNGLNRKLHVIP